MATVAGNAATQLPKWVYDLVLDLIEQEAVHPELLYKPAGREGAAKYGWCPCNALAKVPAEVVVQARAIADYLRAMDTTSNLTTGRPS